MNIGLYMFKGSVLTYLLQYSPKPVHQKVYQESFLKHGGFYPEVIMPQSVMDIILEGKAVTLVPDDAMAIYDNDFTMGKESLVTGFASYYYTLKLPIRKEINRAIVRLQDNGIIQEVFPLQEIEHFHNY